MRAPHFKDIIIFSRITGAALLVCGYLIAGLYLGRWCAASGLPEWTMPLCLLGGLAAALLSGAFELKRIIALVRKTSDFSAKK